MTGIPTRRLVLLGSTGSIGTQALDVVSRYPHIARVHGLAVGGSRPVLVAEQVLAHRPAQLVISDETRAAAVVDAVRQACSAAGVPAPEIGVGADAVVELAGSLGEGDVVLNAITGSVGLLPTLAVLSCGARLALANKESLVVGGIWSPAPRPPGRSSRRLRAHRDRPGPGWRRHEQIDHLVVTASGGPFRGRSRESSHRSRPSRLSPTPPGRWAA